MERRQFLIGTAGAALALPLLGRAAFAHSQTAAAPQSPATIIAPPPAGASLQNPAQLVSRNGILRVRLFVERLQVDVGGQKLWALTYNGQYMPPTLRFSPGDRLELALENRLEEATNLHVHGLHVSPSGNSDNIFIHILPGQTFHYSYQFRDDLQPGTYWYHSHQHGLSAAQVAGGLSGIIIIVDGLRQFLPPDLRNIAEHVIALKDFQVEGDAVKTQDLHIGASTNRTVNGQLNPIIRIRPGETQLWRLANISANIYYNVQLEGQQFQVIAHDANAVDRIFAADSLLLAAGNRFDVLVRGQPGGPPARVR